MDFPLVVDPVECEAKVSFAVPLGCALVVLLDCVKEVLTHCNVEQYAGLD